MKKTSLIIIGIIVVALLGSIGFYVSTQNSIIKLEEKVESAHSDISTNLQRRADLIPNLVNTVKGYAAHEEKVINDVLEAREQIMNAKTISEQGEADQQLSSALSALNVVIENYPDLKASENFTRLQDEIAGTENRIAVSRKDYNDAVREYNTKIKTFPGSIIAGMMNAGEKEYFELTAASKADVPTVDFSEN